MNSSILWASSPTSESVYLLLVLVFCRNGEEGGWRREGCRGEMLQEQLLSSWRQQNLVCSFVLHFPFCEKLMECKEFGIVGGHVGSCHHILWGSSNHSFSSLSLSGQLMLPQKSIWKTGLKVFIYRLGKPLEEGEREKRVDMFFRGSYILFLVA